MCMRRKFLIQTLRSSGVASVLCLLCGTDYALVVVLDTTLPFNISSEITTIFVLVLEELLKPLAL